MDSKRAIGGFCGTFTGLAVGIAQATYPQWFGNHSWIFPASLVVLFAGLILWLCQYRWMQRLLGIKALSTTDTRILESTIESVLARKDIQPETQSRTVALKDISNESEETPSVFDGELYRIVTAPKHAFAELTRQAAEMMGYKFSCDVDVLVEMYIVNVSTEAQYIKDFTATVEIDGKRIDLVRQKDFAAWEVDGTDYVYCLDPKPEEPALLLESRAEDLTPALPSMPIQIAPGQPLSGWIRFLLPNVEPKKLEENRTYRFILIDSFGKQHPITRAAKHRMDSKIGTRKVI